MGTQSLYTITLGGWYQRTTLHLSEIYDFLSHKESHLALDKEKLVEFHGKLDIEKVTRETGYLEYVRVITKSGIEIRYFEDGLYMLNIKGNDIKKAQAQLEHYFDELFNPAINYIFSLGAPTPKILANIRTIHPVVVTSGSGDHENYAIDKSIFGEVSSKITTHDITVYKTLRYIFLVTSPMSKISITELVEMQVFFREFQDQLSKYLNIHRKIWEEITTIKEKREIKGKDVEVLRGKLDSYQKTISMISNRINQMGSYAHTRQRIAKSLEIEKKIVILFDYKFESLIDTLEYIKEVWKMTTDYVMTAIQIVNETRIKVSDSGINSLRLVTTIGVIASTIGFFARDTLPEFTVFGILFVVLLLWITIISNFIISLFYKNKTYTLKFTEVEKNI